MHTLAAVENIFFLILVAVIGLIRWGMAAAESSKNSKAQKTSQPQAPNAPVERAPAQTEEERVRRFMEALGVPTSNAPPQKIPRREVTPKIPRPAKRRVPPIDPFPRPGRERSLWNPLPEPVVVLEPPAVPATPPPLPEQIPTAAEVPVAKEKAPPVFEVHVIEGPTDPSALVRPQAGTGGWGSRLRDKGGLREAIVLREIFGPPRSQQTNFGWPS